ncbi:hypothetical protein Clacol_008823 [Clathrus columnatus]|uniref:T6SS Phospholipase effector Tle1-like catalytic domain-containing protein n=1 Tax=Clathrus columnatus TaxID=1419009 RepID=A0AAV5ANB8_9AGAM|nr:hypothetical protein Clacol_008823 [Clathrus columnatus]
MSTSTTTTVGVEPFAYPVIPPSHPARTLVLCFDGTGDCFDADNSNVVQFFSMLTKDNRKEQMVYYQAGIGTYTVPQIATPFMASVSKTLDMMIAWNLDAHVMGGYEFLMQNSILECSIETISISPDEAGDKICILGFSRGAYTARALAGMVHKVPFAYKMFTRTDDTGWAQSTAFKKAFSMDVDIEFVDANWKVLFRDTVNSVGLIPHRLPFTSSNSSIRTFRHAVSLDEHRVKFKANLYNRPTAKEANLGTKPGEMPKSGTPGDDTIIAENPSTHDIPKHQRARTKSSWRINEAIFDAKDPSAVQKTDVLEVWFAGCHCDVGGGSVGNSSRHNLARIPLRWMIRQCFLTNSGIRFHSDLLRTVGLDPATIYPEVKERPAALYYSPNLTAPTANTPTELDSSKENLLSFGYNGIHPTQITSEEEEDLADALCRIYDQLKDAPYWWILELIPMRLRAQNDDTNEWFNNLTINLGRPRKITGQKRHGIKVHRTVKIRMEAGQAVAEGVAYTPRAKWKIEPTWVD